MFNNRILNIIFSLLLCAAIALLSMFLPKLIGIEGDGFIPRSFFTHLSMMILSLVFIGLFSRKGSAGFGLNVTDYRFSPKILLWVIPTSIVSIVGHFASQGEEIEGMLVGFSKLQCIVFVWIIASVSEEVLCRGLLQSLLARYRRPDAPDRKFSLTVIMSGLFFGAMHLVLLKSMGYAAVPVIVIATILGIIIARYREKTGSIVPAIIIHAL
ncbi:CPBP family intramembrane metalloprotease, partial [bacterium]|nr:CPBP family intramembrane metalloprotease [bacterium]